MVVEDLEYMLVGVPVHQTRLHMSIDAPMPTPVASSQGSSIAQTDTLFSFCTFFPGSRIGTRC